MRERFASGALLFLILLLFISPPVWAQAWTPPKGDLDLVLSYQNLNVQDHTLADGERFDDGHIYTHSAVMEVGYGFTDRLAVKVILPYVASRYDGTDPHQLPIDGGRYHSTFQDFHAELRYNLTARPLVITPSFEVVVPSHSYEYFAHSAVGRDLREFRLGLNLGRRLDPFLPNAFVQAQYSYHFVEEILNIPHNQGFAQVELGYFVNRRLSVIGSGNWRDTYGGFTSKDWDALTDPAADAVALGIITEEQFRHHDQIFHERLLMAGGGAVYQVNPRFAVFGFAMTGIAGANVHVPAVLVTAGVNWTIQTRAEKAKVAGSRDLGGAGGLAQLHSTR